MRIKKFLSALLATTILTGIIPFNAMAAQRPVSITVGKSDGTNFKTIKEALSSIEETPTEKTPVTINIEPGIYEEELNINIPYVKLVNTDKKKDVVITYDKANGHSDNSKNFGTDKTATVTVEEGAVGFEANGITFKNSYNIDTDYSQTQAVALETLADKVVLRNCKMIGRQDTLYLKGASKGQNEYGSSNNARVYLKDCYVEGTVDFIFGDATAFFDNCDLYMAEYENGGHFTAPNTTLFNIGYVFNNCRLSVSEKFTDEQIKKVDLGRPWQCDKAYPNYGSNSVFINCVLPDRYNEEGFSLWNSETITNKVRFMEYGSKTSKGSDVDTSKRADFVKLLNDNQAQYYNVYNVLKGNDNWTPAENSGLTGPCDITVDNYEISIPQGETYTLKATVLPMEESANITFASENTDICEVNDLGVITAKKVGTTTIKVTLPTGLSTYSKVSVTKPRTAIPEIKSLNIVSNNHILPGNIIKANYEYVLASDNQIDDAIIRWYSVKDNKEYLIKEGSGESFKSYTVQNKDIGSQIKVCVLPATTTTYKEYGNPVSYTTEQTVDKTSTSTELLFRENFDNGEVGYNTNGTWNIID
ncbi:MAG: pectinesterase family protein, partial [Lachnospirales bacterium]